MARAFVGCDLGNRYAKAVRLSRAGGRYTLEGYVAVDARGAGAAGTADVSDYADLGTSLGVALTQAGLSRGPAVLGLSSREAHLRYLRLPPVPLWHLRPLLALEVEEVGERTASDMAFDYRMLPVPRRPEDELAVVLAMARSEDVQPRIAALGRAGLSVDEVQPAAVGLYHAYMALAPQAMPSTAAGLSGGDRGGTHLLVDLGHRELTLALVLDGDLVFARGAPMPEDQGPGEQDALYRLVRGGLAFARTQLRSPGLAPDRVVLSGGRAVEPGLAETLGRSLELPVDIFDPTLTLDLRSLERPPSGPQGPSLAVAVGLAIAGLVVAGRSHLGRQGEDAFRLDLLPNPLKERRRYRRSTRWLHLAGGVLATALLVSAGGGLWLRGAAEGRYNELQARGRDLADRAGRVAAQVRQNEQALGLARALHGRAGGGLFLESVLDAVARTAPARLGLDRVRLVEEQGRPVVLLRGEVDNAGETGMALLEEFARGLGADPRVGSARIDGGRTRPEPKRGAVVFEIRVEP